MDEKKMTAAVRKGTLQAFAIAAGVTVAAMAVAYGVVYVVAANIPGTTAATKKTEERKSE